MGGFSIYGWVQHLRVASPSKGGFTIYGWLHHLWVGSASMGGFMCLEWIPFLGLHACTWSDFIWHFTTLNLAAKFLKPQTFIKHCSSTAKYAELSTKIKRFHEKNPSHHQQIMKFRSALPKKIFLIDFDHFRRSVGCHSREKGLPKKIFWIYFDHFSWKCKVSFSREGVVQEDFLNLFWPFSLEAWGVILERRGCPRRFFELILIIFLGSVRCHSREKGLDAGTWRRKTAKLHRLPSTLVCA